jgi:acyl-CoA thioester hydrolase
MPNDPRLSDFPVRSYDKIRYADTDRQGHANNAVFATILETGRVEILYDAEAPLAGPDGEFVIARLVLDFRGEIRWPGTVQVGTRVRAVGKSSARPAMITRSPLSVQLRAPPNTARACNGPSR